MLATSIISTTITRSEIERLETGEQKWEKKFGPAMLEIYQPNLQYFIGTAKAKANESKKVSTR